MTFGKQLRPFKTAFNADGASAGAGEREGNGETWLSKYFKKIWEILTLILVTARLAHRFGVLPQLA